MPYLALSLFGSPQLHLNDEVVDIRAQKALALLAYLVVTAVPHRRDTLATLFWPGYEQASARTYLRQALHEVTKTVGHSWFDVSREEVGLAQDGFIQSDVDEFKRLVSAGMDTARVAGTNTGANWANTLHQAITLYKGDFLAGFSLPDCPEFDQWQVLESESLRHTFAAALQELLRWHTSQQEYAAAIELARRWLALDSYNEAAHRSLMQFYAWTGQQTAALRQYEECKRLLREGLQLSPDPETEALYEAIRSKRLPSPSSHAAPPSQKTQQGTVQSSPPSVVALPSFFSEQIAPTRTTTFVARQRELEELAEALATARLGTGQILFVIGGAGRGKTTLVQEFARRAQREHPDLLVAGGTCNAYTGIGDPYLPFREILTALAGDVETKWAGGQIPTEHARPLWEAMPITLPAIVELAPDLLRAFIAVKPLQARAESFAPPHAPWLQQMRLLANGEQRLPLEERQLFTQFTDALKAIASHRPLLLILEDLHWVDAASNNLLFHLSRTLGESRILVIGTYRPNELMVARNLGHNLDQHPLAAIVGELKRQHGDIWLDLGNLSSAEGQAFVDAYLDTQPNRLDNDFRAALFQHTGGHALFTVELLREMQARGDLRRDQEGYWVASSTTSWSVLPARVEGVIEQRIGRLEKRLQETLAVASIEGESFTAEVVARVRGQAEYEVVQLLSQELDRQHRLVMVESLGRAGQQRISRYRFRHHLFQRYLYNRLTESERAYLHEKVGNALEALHVERPTAVAIHLAHHFEQAGLAEKAVAYLRQAGEHAHHISANQEAIQLITRALALLTALPETLRRDEEEFALRLTLGRAVQQIRGIGSQEAHEIYQRAYELCMRVGNDRDRFATLHGLSGTSETINLGQHFALEMLQIAEKQPNSIYLVSAHHVLGTYFVLLGDYASARVHLEQSIALYEPRQHQEYLLLCGQDEGIAALANLGLTLWHLGYPDQALQRGQEAILLAEELSHPMSMAIAKHYEVWIHNLRGAAQIAHQKIDLLQKLASEQGFGYVIAVAELYRAQALLLEGQMDAAIEHFERVREKWLKQYPWNEPFALLALVTAFGRIGHIEHALDLLSKAEAAMESDPSFDVESLFYRIKGELLLAQAMATGDSATGNEGALQMEQAEAAFMQAIQLARTSGSKSRELQATIGLCRLWKHQGKIAEARSALAEIYGWFTEGFATADLVDAKALLEELEIASTHTNSKAANSKASGDDLPHTI